MPGKVADVRPLIHSPAESAKLTQEMVRQMQANPGKGVIWGLPEIDADMRPMRPGDLVTILGYTSHLKSFYLNYLALEEAKRIRFRQATHEIVVKLTWEQSVEEDTLSWLANYAQIPIYKMVRGTLDGPEWDILQQTAVRRSVTPLWVIGHSISIRKARPRMTMDDAAVALDMICDKITGEKKEPTLIIFDYLQRIRPAREDGNTRREQMLEIVNRVKDCAVAFGAPAVLGVQSKRMTGAVGVENIPTIEGGQETSGIEQASDIMFGSWYPIKTESFGSLVEGYKVTPELALLALLKLKLGSAPHSYFLNIDPSQNTIRGAKKRN